MNVQTDKAALQRALGLAAAIADLRSTMPILASVKIETVNDGLMLASTDLNLTLIAAVKCEVTEAGSVCIKARQLYELVKALSGKGVELRSEERAVVQISSGNAVYRLPALPAEDYPRLPRRQDATVSQVRSPILLDLIERTMPATAMNETQYLLNGAFLTATEGSLRLIATDGHRLHLTQADEPGVYLSQGILIPRRGLEEAKRFLKEVACPVDMAVENGHWFLRAEDLTLVVKLTNAEFPPFDTMLPTSYCRSLIVDRQTLMDAVRRLLLIASQTYAIQVVLAPGAPPVLLSDGSDRGEAKELLDAEYVGEPMTIGVNAKLLLEALGQAQADQVVVSFNNELDPIKIAPSGRDDYLAICMPLKLK